MADETSPMEKKTIDVGSARSLGTGVVADALRNSLGRTTSPGTGAPAPILDGQASGMGALKMAETVASATPGSAPSAGSDSASKSKETPGSVELPKTPEMIANEKRISDITSSITSEKDELKTLLKPLQGEIPVSVSEQEAGAKASEYEAGMNAAGDKIKGLGGEATELAGQTATGMAVNQIAEGIMKAFAAAHGATNVDIKGLDWNQIHQADMQGLNMKREGYQAEMQNKRDVMNKYLSEQSRLQGGRESRQMRNQEMHTQLTANWNMKLDEQRNRLLESKRYGEQLTRDNISGISQALRNEAKIGDSTIKENKIFLSSTLPTGLASAKPEVANAMRNKLAEMVDKTSFTGDDAYAKAKEGGFTDSLMGKNIANKTSDLETMKDSITKLNTAMEASVSKGKIDPLIMGIRDKLSEVPGAVSQTIPAGKIQINPSIDSSQLLINLMSKNDASGQLLRSKAMQTQTSGHHWFYSNSDAYDGVKNLFGNKGVSDPKVITDLYKEGISPFAAVGMSNAEGSAFYSKIGKGPINYTDLTDKEKTLISRAFPASAVTHGMGINPRYETPIDSTVAKGKGK